MSDEKSWNVIEVMPTLSVGDLDEALSFYEGLGFQKQWAYPAETSPTHLGLSFGPVNVMLARFDDRPEVRHKQDLYFIMRNLSDYHRMLRSALGEDVPDIVDADYGMRDFALEDPWGHLLTFGEAC